MSVPFVGPSYNLTSRTADLQRTIGLIPLPIEPANTRSKWIFRDVQGLTTFTDMGAKIRGMFSTGDGRAFVVAGSVLYELFDNGAKTAQGTLATNLTRVGLAANAFQIVVSDAVNLYIMPLSGGTFQTVAFGGKARIDYINQRIVFVYRDTQRFGWTKLNDAATIDALDFASTESSPDKLVGVIVDHREVLLLGSDSVEDWLNTTSAAVFERNNGVAIELGTSSEFSFCKLGESVYWLASSSRGQGSVIRMQGYLPVKVSTQAIEQRLAGLDLSGAYAYAYEHDKSEFYCVNVPGLNVTLVYDAFTNQWHERAEVVSGEYTPWRPTCHMFAFGKHLFGTDSGKLYWLDQSSHTNDGDPLVRRRIMPTAADPFRNRVKFERFILDCDRGTGGVAQMRYSTNNGANWSDWVTRSMGQIGVYHGSVQWKRLRRGKDMVVDVQCTDNVPWNPISGLAE